jgi:hypothetical protein
MRGSSRAPAVALCLTVLAAARLGAQPFPRQDLPPELRPWVAWVLDDAKDHVCPAVDGNAICLWPGRLRLQLARRGGSFRQELLADRAIEAPLPGDEKHWPQGVTLDGKPAPVFEQEGVPTLRIAAGPHSVEGRFEWRQLPDSLSVPATTALVDLTVEGAAVSLPSRDEQGMLWLRKEGAESTAAAESLQVQAFRKIQDGQPVFVDTTLLLEVSGKAREIELRGGLLAGSAPVSVSGDLPAQIDKSGRLRIQVRSGRFTVSVLARIEGRPETLTAPEAKEPWPDHEVWVFEANELLRQVQLSGGTAVDPSRTDLPEAWRKLPAFSMSPGAGLTLKEARRGEPDAAPDKLKLRREMWLDLDGRALTVRDNWSGDLNRTWRLDLVAGELGRVAVDGTDQLVTSNPEGGATGVELRTGALQMVADSRVPRSGGLPAVGWSGGVEQLQATLNLPPGWRLVGATGVDSLPGAWVSRWTLLGFFFVLLVVFGVQRLLGWRAAVFALLAVGLSYHEADAPFLTWLSLLGACAVLRVAPEGKLRTFGRVWWWASLVVLGLVLVPFFRDQIKVALFPQVEEEIARTKSSLGMLGGAMAPQAVDQAMPAAPAVLSAPMPAEAESKLKSLGYVADARAKVAAAKGSVPLQKAERSTLSSALQQDPHAVVQTGPGVPTWSWQSFSLSWSGPVDKGHRMRLFLLSPGANRVLTFLRLALIAILAYSLWRLGRGTPTPMPEPSETLPGIAVALALAALALAAPVARAQDSPSPAPQQGAAREVPPSDILEELKNRLTRPEPCQPNCVTTPFMALAIEGERLSFSAEVHAAARASWVVPGPAGTWVPADVRVDGQSSSAVVRLEDGFLRVRLEPGVHRVEASGPLPRQDGLTLQLKDRPLRATASAPGWEVVGVREEGPADESVELNRRLRPGHEAATSEGVYSPWLEVQRTIESGVTWRVYTTVRRVSPLGSPVAVRIPLLPGEALTEGDWETKDGEVAFTLGRDEAEAKWTSTLKMAEVLDLKAPEGRPWSEVWTLRCGVVWQCQASGIPPVRHETEGLYQPEFHPWPGESLKVAFRRPGGVSGQTLTLDDVQLDVTPGIRLETATLTLKTRAAREDALSLTLPAGAEVQEVSVAGAARPIRPEGDKLSLTIPGGAQGAVVKWHRGQGLRTFYGAPRVGLSIPAVNVHVNVTLPEDRWLLRAQGPAWGPAVLFWGYLLVALLAAWILSRLPGSPLTAAQWALLALGLSQIPAVAAFVVAGFFFVLAWRRSRPLGVPLFFDVFQLVLVLWALVTVGCLYSAIETGLVLRPDMQVAGNGSSETLLRFYADRVADTTPAVTIVSFPLWAYRVLMLVWSGWLALSLVRWIAWSWRAFTEGGAWKPLRSAEKPKPGSIT